MPQPPRDVAALDTEDNLGEALSQLWTAKGAMKSWGRLRVPHKLESQQRHFSPLANRYGHGRTNGAGPDVWWLLVLETTNTSF